MKPEQLRQDTLLILHAEGISGHHSEALMPSSQHRPPLGLESRPSAALICRGQRAASSCGAVFARITVEPLEFIGIDGAQHPRREGPLEESADPAGAIPAR